MKVKLTRREPTAESYNEAQRWTGDQRIRHALIAAYDAAPDDATRALVEFARVLHDLEENHPEDVDPHLKAAWDKFTATPEGAALIRQAEND